MISANRRAVTGFTMLEVLIAIVILSFGLLGLAGLQAFALQNNQNASLRGAAVLASSDMIDRMKANYQGVINADYHKPAAANYTTAVANCLAVAGCTATEMANHDAFEWQQLVGSTLPGGVGRVCLDNTPNDAAATPAAPLCDNTGVRYVIKIWWLDDRSQANTAGNLRLFVVPFNP